MYSCRSMSAVHRPKWATPLPDIPGQTTDTDDEYQDTEPEYHRGHGAPSFGNYFRSILGDRGGGVKGGPGPFASPWLTPGLRAHGPGGMVLGAQPSLRDSHQVP